MAVLGLIAAGRLSLVASSGSFSLVVFQHLLIVSSLAEHGLWGAWGAEGVACRLGCSAACGMFPDQELSSCLLRWQADATTELPGKPLIWFFIEPLLGLEVKVKVAQLCPTLWPQGLYSPWNSPGQNTGVGSLSLLQGIFPNQGLNPGLPHCRQILYQLSHKGSSNRAGY